MSEIWSNLPEGISQIIMHGFLDKNLLDFLLERPIEILQMAIIMEKSSRRIKSYNKNIMSFNKQELISYILNRMDDIKLIRSYIRKVEKNLYTISKLKIDDIICFNNGITHKYYILKKFKKDEDYYCLELSTFSARHLVVDLITNDEIVVTKSNMKTAILFESHCSQHIRVRHIL